MSKLKTYVVLAIIIAIGLVMRVYHNLDISLWHDEAFSALLIKYPLQEMIYRIGLDVHPPMYYFALRFWAFFFGDSLAALRGFSVFFGTATILASYDFVKAAFKSNKAALLAAALIAVNPFQIQYATEARMYTFGAFLAVAAAYFLVKMLQPHVTDLSARSKWSQWFYAVAFGLASGAAVLTHYYLLFTIAAICFYALCWHIYFYKFQWKKYVPLILSFFGIALIFLPWINWFLYQFKQVGGGYWIPPMDKWSIPSTLYQMLIGTGVDVNKTGTQWLLVAMTVAIIALTIHFLSFRRKPESLLETTHVKTNKNPDFRRDDNPRLQFRWLIVLSWLSPFLGSILFYLLSVLTGSDSSVYLVRYFSFAVPFFSIMIAVWLSNLPLYNSTALPLKKYAIWAVTFTLASALIVINVSIFFNYWRELKIEEKGGMAQGSQLIIDQAKPNDKLIVGSSFKFFNLKYYLQQAEKKRLDIPAGLMPLPKPKLYSGGQETIDNMPHFAGTAILTNEDLFPNFEDVNSGETVWLLWTNSFGGSKPVVPENWIEVSEHGFAEVRPYVGTWVVVTEYQVR